MDDAIKTASSAVVEKRKKTAQYLPHTIEARYKLGEVLGEGGFAVVKLGISNIDKKKVAVKIISRANLKPKDEDNVRQEVQILQELNHPNITRQLDFFVEDSNFYVVLEFLGGGELFDRIVKKKVSNKQGKENTHAVYSIV